MKINVKITCNTDVTDDAGNAVDLPSELISEVEDGKSYEYTPATLVEVAEEEAK